MNLVKLEQISDMLRSQVESGAVKGGSAYVLKNGRIAESGTHEELMKNRGGYYEMYSSQSSLENYTRKETVVL